MSDWNMNANEARCIARYLHAEQVDKAGAPYFGHLSRVAAETTAQMEHAKHWVKDAAPVVAWLHDAIEDGHTTIAGLKALGLTDHQANALDAITRRPDEVYLDYIDRVLDNDAAWIVKVADLRDNLGRLDALDAETQGRLESRYERALGRLIRHARYRPPVSVEENQP